MNQEKHSCFSIVNISNVGEVERYNTDEEWVKSPLLPQYGELFVCFRKDGTYDYNTLLNLFLFDDSTQEIGAISLIAEYYSEDLLDSLSKDNRITEEKAMFLLNNVIPFYLPLVIPPAGIERYIFSTDYQDNTWVKILEATKLLVLSD